jgi:hypothetical protein
MLKPKDTALNANTTILPRRIDIDAHDHIPLREHHQERREITVNDITGL